MPLDTVDFIPIPKSNNHPIKDKVVIAGRDSLTTGLLAKAIVEYMNCQAVPLRSSELMRAVRTGDTTLVVVSANCTSTPGGGFDLVRSVSAQYPDIPIVILLDEPEHDQVIRAFRSGARGVFDLHDSVEAFIDCVEHVRRGSIWAGKEATESVLNSIKTIPVLPESPDGGLSALTSRELQVVRCASRGKTNKKIAEELHLSEHTVKNHLFRAFEKLGVSSRVELLFCLASLTQTDGPRNGNGHHREEHTDRVDDRPPALV